MTYLTNCAKCGATMANRLGRFCDACLAALIGGYQRDVTVAAIDGVMTEIARAWATVGRQARTIRRLRALADGYRARAKYNSDEDKYFLKARIYGAIAAEFRRALCAIAEGHGDPQSVARDALAWRHSVKVGVPMEAVLAIGDLLLSAESAAKDERARIVAWLRERAGSWRTGIGYECEAIATELDSRADRLERGE